MISFVWRILIDSRRQSLLSLIVLLLLCGPNTAVLVQAAPIAGGYVQLSPTSAAITQGQTVQLRAAVMSPLGFELANRQVTWKSSNPAVAGVSAAGLVTAVAPGSATITAKSGAALGTVTINVSGAPVNTAPTVAITSPADGSSFQSGASIGFAGVANDLQSGNLSTLIVWTAAPAADPNGAQTQIGTGASVATSSLAAGSYLVTASATDSGGLTGIAQVGITVQGPCTLSPRLQPKSGDYLPQQLQLDATSSSDSCGRQLQYRWYCQSDVTTYCHDFLPQANSGNLTNATPVFDLQEYDLVGIAVQICVAGTDECSPVPDPDGPNYVNAQVYEGVVVH